MSLLYVDGFGVMGGVRQKIKTLFIAILNPKNPLWMKHRKEKRKKAK